MNDNLTFFLVPVLGTRSHSQNHIIKSFLFLFSRCDSKAQESFDEYWVVKYCTVLVKKLQEKFQRKLSLIIRCCGLYFSVWKCYYLLSQKATRSSAAV